MKPLEKMLFHGTRATDPIFIYKGAEGFDMKFSNGGMWGQAIYFAQNASYSDQYAHETFSKEKQFFYARVQVGRYIELPSNKTLKYCPNIAGSTTERYDSVKGQTGGSDVYMIYTNAKAYPEYLITYKMN